MKKVTNKQIIMILFLITGSYVSVAQKVGEIVTLKAPTKIQNQNYENIVFKISNNDSIAKLKYLETGIKFQVVDISKDTVKLIALPFNKLSITEKINYKLIYNEEKRDLSDDYNNKVYSVQKTDFLEKANVVKPTEKLSIGLLTLPYKARILDDNLSFDLEFNLNTTLKYNIKEYRNKISLNAIIGAGIGTVNLNSSNAPGVVDSLAQDVTSLTFLLGGLIQYKNAQFGVFTGFDFINNQEKYKWKGNGKLWFGIGIGYNLFNVTLSEKKNNKQQTTK